MQAADRVNASSAGARAHTLRGTARELAIRGLEVAGQLGRARRRIAARGSVVVLTLHRIVPDEELDACRSPRGMVLRESLFAQLLDYLQEVATLVAPHEADAAAAIPGRPRVLLTFDDGWVDNLEIALPHLSRANIHAYFFAVTAFAGRQSPFWPERMLALLARAGRDGQLGMINTLLGTLQPDAQAIRPVVTRPDHYEELLRWLKQFPGTTLFQWIDTAMACLEETSHGLHARSTSDRGDRLMTWEQLQLLIDAGHSVGSHTCTHALLPQLDPEQLASELQQSRHALEEHLRRQGSNPMWISYPNGSASSAVAVAARDAQYGCGFVNAPGLWQPGADRFLIPRVNVWDGTVMDGDGIFSAKQVDYALFWRAQRAAAQA